MNKFVLEDKIQFHATNGEGPWTTVYSVDNTSEERQFIGCVLADRKLIEESFEELGWSQFYIDFKPTFIFEDETNPIYSRYGTDIVIKPVIIERNYRGLFPKEIEISEEFRHFFNIYTNGYKEGTYVKIDEFGNEDEIVKFKTNHVQIKTEYLKKYAAAKNLEILVLFEYFRNFKETLEEVGIQSNQIYSGTDEQLNFQVDFQSNMLIRDYQFNARLLGKKWIKGLINYKPQSIYDTINKEVFEEFIVKLDDSGNPVYKSCNTSYTNPDKDASFLSPIYFKREVLRKYYENPNRFEIRDRLIHKIGGWFLPVDNNHKDYVIVFLGDLGRNLPSIEQTHWKSYNIPKSGYMSKSYYKNMIEGEFSSPDLSEFIFKNGYEKLNSSWLMSFGFSLFMKLHKDDEFHLQTLRIPLSDSVNEFDNQILSLIKLLIDSINEKAICKNLEKECKDLSDAMKLLNPNKTPKGLDKLQLFLESKKYKRTNEFIQYLKSIQELRSSSVAHRKGTNYDKVSPKFNIGEKSYIDIFDDILKNINSYFSELISLYEIRFELTNDSSIMDLDE
jgi:hypothetical protein